MGGGEQKQTSYQKSDPWEPAQPALNAALSGAMDAYNNTYQGQQVAGIDPLIRQSQDMQIANANSGALGAMGRTAGSNLAGILNNGGLSQEQSDAAGGISNALGNFNNNQNTTMSYLTPYASGAMRDSNPYLNTAIDNAMSDAATATNRQFSASGRYGSGAQTDALTSRLGKIATDARMNAYNQDTTNQLNAIGQMGQLNSAGLSGNVTGQDALGNIGQQRIANSAGIANAMPSLDAAANIDASRLANVGGANMNYAQTLIDSANTAPWTRVGNLAQIAGGIGSLGGTQVGTQTKSNSGGMAGLGGILSGIGSIGNLFSGGAGSAASGIGSALSSLLSFLPFSDERLKENIEPVGQLDNGLPVYTFNYKGDGTPQMGLMAQEVEKVNPEAVFEDPESGFKKVHYGLASRVKRAA